MLERITEAHLLPSDVARLLNLSRVTVSRWLNGHSRPHQLHEYKVKRLLDAVDRAMDSGDLPVPHDIKRSERAAYLTKVLVKHLQRK